MIIPIYRHHLNSKGNRKFKIRIRNLKWYLKRSQIYWPTHKQSLITSPEKILIGVSDEPGNKVRGCYIQGYNGLLMGGYTYIGPNVGIITANHDLTNLSNPTVEKPVIIGKYCWIGMGSIITPGVQLGDHVVVGANCVVTKDIPSFSVVAGNPGKIIKGIDPADITFIEDKSEYYGFIKKDSKEGRLMTEKRVSFIKGYEEKYSKIISESIRNEVSEFDSQNKKK